MKGRGIWIIGLLAALAIAGFLSPYASKFPDGLDRVAEDLGFRNREHKAYVSAPLPDYKLPGIRSERWSGAAAGVIGVLIVFALAGGCGLLLRRQRR